MGNCDCLRPTPTAYPNRLDSPEPFRPKLPCRWWVVAALVLAALMPRAVLAVRTPAVCPDGALYIQLAQALDRGDYRAGFEEVRLNTYPVILVLLHRLGFDWETGGKWWSVLAGTLVVLPLYGWTRRQFDEQIGVIAAILYAFHGALIEWTPEVLRDPTFWLFFTLALYFGWRAAAEVRFGWYAAAGLAATLAVLTRTEGLILLVPLGLWSFWRHAALTDGRHRVVSGFALCLAVGPALIVAANVAWLRHHDRWELWRTKPFEMVGQWFHSAGQRPAAVPSAVSGSVLEVPAPKSTGQLAWSFLNTLERGLTPVFGVVLVTGAWRWRRVWWRRDQQPLFFAALALAAGIWIQIWYTQSPSFRYALPIVLLQGVFAALATRGMAARVRDWTRRWGFSLRWQRAVAFTPLAIIALVGLADSLTRNYDQRQRSLGLGRWLHQRYPGATIVTTCDSWLRVAAYYGRARTVPFYEQSTPDDVAALVERSHPDLVLLPRDRVAPRCLAELTRRFERLGYRPLAEPADGGVAPDLVTLAYGPPRDAAVAADSPDASRRLATLPRLPPRLGRRELSRQ